MNKLTKVSVIAAIVGCGAVRGAAAVSLFDYLLNLDGVTGTTLPVGSNFDASTGLGSVKASFSSGLHYGALFVDHEINETLNGFSNETGERSAASPPAGLSWEIDEPGFAGGDIYGNISNGALDNGVGVIPGGAILFPNDVSMALGWGVFVSPGFTANLEFLVTDDANRVGPGAFYLKQSDPDSDKSLYFTTSLEFVGPDPSPVPDSGVNGGLCLGVLIGIDALRRKLSCSVS